MRLLKAAGLVAGSLLVLGALARAGETLLPARGFLACPSSCAPDLGAQHHNRLPFVTPSAFEDYPDGYIRLRIVTGGNGAVHAVNVLRLVGPAKLAENAVREAQRWDAGVSAADVKPVSHVLDERFAVGGYGPLRVQINSARDDSEELAAAGKLDEAEQRLKGLLLLPKPNMRERAWIAGLLAPFEIRKNEFRAAFDLLDEPTSAGIAEDRMPADLSAMRQLLLRLRIQAAFGLGDVAGAVTTLEDLEKTKGFDPADRIVAAVARLRSDLDARDIIPISGLIPAKGAGDGYYVELYRRDFDFHVISGSLDRYGLDCNQGVTESAADEKIRHHVPDDWGPLCHLFVTGTPDTLFEIRQFKA